MCVCPLLSLSLSVFPSLSLSLSLLSYYSSLKLNSLPLVERLSVRSELVTVPTLSLLAVPSGWLSLGQSLACPSLLP